MDFYTPDSMPVITPEMFYGPRRNVCGICLIILSHEIHQYLLESFKCVETGRMAVCNGITPIYTFEHAGKSIAFYLSAIGSSMAGHQVIEANWLTGAECFIMCGSAGTLDQSVTAGRYVIPDKALRGEGLSGYYAPPGEWIEVTGARTVQKVFDELGIPYVSGHVWTTDAFYRETSELVRRCRDIGCIAVDMELAGVQAVCDYHGLRLYDFLEPGDILEENDYSIGTLQSANHDVRKLMIALEIALRL